ncbi:hypothetical protein F383_20757 [Gossypium arboreum]|uniref:Uncharacterized protein n=1 Tax=Gossypium arboreum TaxID=29729 RepID=A0A0B0MJL2_GOSAR|nr:hypothetical protein F383_20757 [Gossypium arboreum]
MRTPFCSPLCSSSKGLCQAFNFFENRLRPTKQGPPVVRARCNSGHEVVENEGRGARARAWSGAHGDRAWSADVGIVAWVT